jgi:hypothetical protein
MDFVLDWSWFWFGLLVVLVVIRAIAAPSSSAPIRTTTLLAAAASQPGSASSQRAIYSNLLNMAGLVLPGQRPWPPPHILSPEVSDSK